MSAKNESCEVSNVIIESRRRIHISGVKDVLSFDDETVALDSCLGRITVKGEELRITGFNTESGDLTAEGRIHAAVYLGDRSTGGFISRLFK